MNKDSRTTGKLDYRDLKVDPSRPAPPDVSGISPSIQVGN